jgi:CheY-like chemotaxis protein/HPt (histidine-containing phosphotransfer) domain-containing protein
MPGLDGFQIAARIRRRPELAGATIMMLSSADRHGDALRCRELGIVRYLTKPVKQSDLLDAILAALASTQTGRGEGDVADAGAGSSLSSPPLPLRVLLVEDNATNQMLAVRILEKQGHAITVAGNGKEALAVLGLLGSAPSGEPPFDLVLMDVQMPEMDGLETTAAIRAHERNTGRHLPILAMTAHAMKGDREQCLAAGMDGYLSKPIQPAELRQAIAVLGRKTGEEKPISSLVSPSSAPLPPTPAEDGTVKAMELAVALESVGGDRQLLQELIGMFLLECPDLLTALRKAIAAGDGPTVHRAAHTIKGAVNMFGARAVYDGAQRLETMGRQNDLAQADLALAALEQELDRLTQDLAALQ